MGDTTFLVTWDDTGNVGLVNLTKDELKELTTRSGSDKGEQITSMLKHPFDWCCGYSQKSDEKYL